MESNTGVDYARVRPMLELARSFVEPMTDQIKYLVTGGLTEAQSIDADGENNEDVVVRGIGSNPIQEMRLEDGYPSDISPPVLLCRQITGLLRFDWVSLGVLIGYKDSMINPLDVFTVRITEINTNIGSSQEDVSDDMLYDLALLILGGFRIHMASNQTYIDRLQTALKAQLINPDFSDGVEVAITNFAQLYSDPEFVKLACGMDMFFAVFPQHNRAKLRFGTLIMAHKNCTGLSAITAGCELMHHTTRVFSRWLMTPVLRSDMNRMTIPGQEICIPYSYSPYLSGLGIVDKSPYSAALNCGLHMFTHMIGCAVPMARSVNAIYFQPSGLQAIIDNAILFIYAHSCTGSLQMQFFRASEVGTVKKVEEESRHYMEEMRKRLQDFKNEEGQRTGSGDEEEDVSRPSTPESSPSEGGGGDLEDLESVSELGGVVEGEPTSRDALDWYMYISRYYHGSLPARMRDVAFDRWSKLTDVRPNTVGEFVKRMSKNVQP
ncbi:AAEL000991-PA [Aedes aegypti]|uniref:AAEL000991-PA n=1 Tax=Aedes aegypti TaxID=7159 RepID=Q17MJ1_AEDAE|nr:AAEL000991-PA [Aedes aegypti]